MEPVTNLFEKLKTYMSSDTYLSASCLHRHQLIGGISTKSFQKKSKKRRKVTIKLYHILHNLHDYYPQKINDQIGPNENLSAKRIYILKLPQSYCKYLQ